MKTVGIFEAKAKLSEICDQVAKGGEPVTITRRGKPLVTIDPIERKASSVKERRARYMTKYGSKEAVDDVDFDIPPRSRDVSKFNIEG